MLAAASAGTELFFQTMRNVPVALERAPGALMIAVTPATNVSASTSNRRFLRIPFSSLPTIGFGHSSEPRDGGSKGLLGPHRPWPVGLGGVPRRSESTL